MRAGKSPENKEKKSTLPIKGDGKEFDPGTPWTIPSFGPSQRTFKCMGYDEEYTGHANSICCDGLVKGATLHLSHWNNNKTPEQLYSDLSTEIALRFIKTSASREPEWKTALVVNNHFDADGVCATWATLKPDLGWKHRRMLVDAAAVGDFNEWPRMDENGLKLYAAITALANTVETDKEKYDVVLERMESMTDNIDQYEMLWGPYMAEIAQGIQTVEKLRADVENMYIDNSIAVVILPYGTIEPPGPVLQKTFGHAVDRYLIATEIEPDSENYTYRYDRVGHAWAPTKQRNPRPMPYVQRLVLRLKESTGVEWTADVPGMVGVCQSINPSDMEVEEVVAVLREWDNTLTTNKKISQRLEKMSNSNAKNANKDDVLSADKLGKKKSLRY